VGIRHVFHRISNQLARRQGVQHPAVAHGDPVIDSNRIKFLGHATGSLDLSGNQLAEILQMHVTRHKLREGVHDSNDRFAEIAVFHASGTPE